MSDVIEALYEYFAANLGIWELLGVLISGTATVLIFYKKEIKWTPYTIYWALFPIYITIIRRWLGAGGHEIHHGRLASDVLNVCMTMPFGLAAYKAFEKMLKDRASSADSVNGVDSASGANVWKLLLLSTAAGLLLSGFIETMQSLSGLGVGEWLDIMTNTLGALLGAIVSWRWFLWWDHKHVKKHLKSI